MSDESLRDEIHNLSVAVANLNTTIAVSQERQDHLHETVGDLKVGVNKDRDELAEWKRDRFYPFQTAAETAIIEFRKALDWKRTLVVAGFGGLLAALGGEGFGMLGRLLAKALV